MIHIVILAILKFIFSYLAPPAKPENISVQGHRIDIKDIRPGDIIVVKREGPLSAILSFILKRFESSWDRWGWHTCFVSRHTCFVSRFTDQWIICEAAGEGVIESPLSKYAEVRAYRWFDPQLGQTPIDAFVAKHKGDQYDVLCYFWTATQYLIRHIWNREIPRLLDDRYTCWELVFQFCADNGKPIDAAYDCPIITDLLRAMGEL